MYVLNPKQNKMKNLILTIVLSLFAVSLVNATNGKDVNKEDVVISNAKSEVKAKLGEQVYFSARPGSTLSAVVTFTTGNHGQMSIVNISSKSSSVKRMIKKRFDYNPQAYLKDPSKKVYALKIIILIQ